MDPREPKIKDELGREEIINELRRFYIDVRSMDMADHEVDY